MEPLFAYAYAEPPREPIRRHSRPRGRRLLRERALAPQRATVRLANDALVPATRMAFRGQVEVDDYYDDAGAWTGLVGKLADGSRLEYRRV